MTEAQEDYCFDWFFVLSFIGTDVLFFLPNLYMYGPYMSNDKFINNVFIFMGTLAISGFSALYQFDKKEIKND